MNKLRIKLPPALLAACKKLPPAVTATCVALLSVSVTMLHYWMTGGRWAPVFHSENVPLVEFRQVLKERGAPFRVHNKKLYVKPESVAATRAEFSRSSYWTTPPEPDVRRDIESVLPSLVTGKRVLLQTWDRLVLAWVDGGMPEEEAHHLGYVLETLARAHNPQYTVRVLDDNGRQLHQGFSEQVCVVRHWRGAMCTAIPINGSGGRYLRIWCPGDYRSTSTQPSYVYVHSTAQQLDPEKYNLLNEIQDHGCVIAYQGRIPNLKGIKEGRIEQEDFRKALVR